MRFYIFDSAGAILRWGEAPEDQVDIQAQAGEFLGRGEATSFTHWIRFDGAKWELVAYADEERARLSARPKYPARWDIKSKQWIDERSLEAVRADTWKRIKEARSVAERSGFACQINGVSYTFDSDPESQRRIQGAAQSATAQPFSVVWTLADNSTVTLDGPGMISVGSALTAWINACHSKGRELRRQIETATNITALNAIHW